jgi:hypothetical protein
VISEESKAQLRRLMELRQVRDDRKTALKTAEEEYRDAEADTFEALEGIEGAIKIDLGDPWGTVAFHQRETFFARVIDEEAAASHYKSRGRSEEAFTPKFRMAVLNEDVRDAREQGTDPPPGIDWVPRRGVTITRQKN